MAARIVVSSCLLLVTSLSVGTAASFEAIDEDEFTRPETTFSQAEPAAGGAAGTWEDDKLSLLRLWSKWWASQEIVLETTEYLCIFVIVLYVLVYIRGRRRSHDIANNFIRRVHGLFCHRFLEAGPASQAPPADRRQLLTRESPSSFLYYATGNRACDGVLVRISLANRHDIFMLAWSLFSPVTDTVTLEVALDDEDMEPMVFAVTRKRSVKQLLVDVPHIHDYAVVVRSSLIPPELACLAETPALTESLLSPAAKTLSEYPDLLELIHFTDQNGAAITGRKDIPKKMLRFRFRIGDLQGAEKMVGLALMYLEFLHNFKMNPGVKKKALERREAVAKRKVKLTHAQRQERFQQLKNERLQREREEYESLTPEQKRRRDMKDEKRAKKANSRKPKVKMTKA